MHGAYTKARANARMEGLGSLYIFIFDMSIYLIKNQNVKINTPEMVWEANGEESDTEHDGGDSRDVQEVPHHQLLQLPAAGDLAGVVPLEHWTRI